MTDPAARPPSRSRSTVPRSSLSRSAPSRSALGSPSPSSPLHQRPRVVAVAVELSRRNGVIQSLNRVVEAGGSALMITAEGVGRSEELLDGVEMLDLAEAERRLGLNAALARDPSRWLLRAQGRVPPRGPSPAWAWWSTSKPYRMIRPWTLWRALRRHELDRVRVDEVDHVIIVHQNSWPIAWQLRRRNPLISIAYEVPDEVWGRAGRPIPPPIEPEPAG